MLLNGQILGILAATNLVICCVYHNMTGQETLYNLRMILSCYELTAVFMLQIHDQQWETGLEEMAAFWESEAQISTDSMIKLKEDY